MTRSKKRIEKIETCPKQLDAGPEDARGTHASSGVVFRRGEAAVMDPKKR